MENAIVGRDIKNDENSFTVMCNDQSIEKIAETEGTVKRNISDFASLVHVTKSSLGTGILAMPNGFKNGGILLGLFGTPIIGFLCAHCAYMMVRISQEMCKRLGRSSLSYSETIEAVFKNCANKQCKSLTTVAKISVEIFIFFTYYGTNSAYIILVAQSYKEIVENHFAPNLDIRVYIIIVGIPIYFVGIVKSMKYLAPFSVIANILLAIGLVLIFIFLVAEMPPLDSRSYFAPISRIPVFFSTVLFGLEGIGTILPIENSMRNPKHFLGCPGVLTIAMSIVIVLYVTVGFFGYMKFGEETTGSITFNLPGEGLSEWVKGLVAIAVFFTYGLQLTASVSIVWRQLEGKFSFKKKNIAYFIVRSVMIVGTVFIAVAVPNLGPVISLIGALGLSMCGVFFPAVIDILFLWDSGYGLLRWKLIKNSILVILSIFALLAGTVTSLHDIVNTYT